MKFGPISVTWRAKRELSSRNWLLDETPEGGEEAYHFEHPELFTSPEDTRDILHNDNLRQDIKMKRHFEWFAYAVAIPWIFMLVTVVLLQGFGVCNFKLETPEFIAVITTTTATVIGLAYIVGNYLFGQAGANNGPNQ